MTKIIRPLSCCKFNSGAQPVIIGKNLAQQLHLRATHPCLYSIPTLNGSNKYVMSQMEAASHLIIRVGDGPTNAHIPLKSTNMGLTNYNILFSSKFHLILKQILGMFLMRAHPFFTKDACVATFKDKGEYNNDFVTIGSTHWGPPLAYYWSNVVSAPNGEPKMGKDTKEIDDWPWAIIQQILKHKRYGHDLLIS